MIYSGDSVIHLLNNWGPVRRHQGPVHTYLCFVRINGYFVFRFVLPSTRMYSVKTVAESPSFQKRSLECRFFETAGFSFTCGRTKTEVFQYDDVLHHVPLAWRMLRKGCYRLSFVLAFSCGWPKTIRIRCFSGWVFFLSWKREKKISVFKKKTGYVWTGPKIQNKKYFFFLVLSWHKCYDFSFIHQTSSLECKKQKHYCLPKIHPQQ